ncbi:unnamed protein product, partial [Polarella glacialis]
DIELVLAKWERGDKKGLVSMVWQAFVHNMVSMKRAKATSQATQLSVHKFLEGNAKATLRACYSNWMKDALHSKHLQQEKTQLTELMNGERAKAEREWKEQHDEQKRKTETAHNAVVLMIHKWELGDAKGLTVTIFQAWAKRAMKNAEEDRRLGSVQMCLSQFTAGKAKGALQSIFLHWKHDSTVAAQEKKNQAQLDLRAGNIQEMLADEKKRHMNEIQLLESKAQIAKEKAKAAVSDVMARFALGEKKGILESVLKSWNQFVMDTKRSARRRQAVHDAVMQSLMGKDKAAVTMAFLNWKSLTDGEKKTMDGELKFEKEKAHWEAQTHEMARLHEK